MQREIRNLITYRREFLFELSLLRVIDLMVTFLFSYLVTTDQIIQSERVGEKPQPLPHLMIWDAH